jgi:hypothetical protein
MTRIDPALTDHQQYWLKHIRACDAAGKPSVDYAREHGIEVSTMYSARKALAEKGVLPKPRPARFQKAAVVDATAAVQWQIQLPNGTLVGFSGEVTARTLETVLRTVASLA